MTMARGYSFAELPLTIEAWTAPAALRSEPRVAARAAALRELDPMVRRQIGRIGSALPLSVESTVYDALFPATPAIGGHWTATSVWMGLLTHAIATYSVALAFDADDRPHHFEVTGARAVVTPDTSEAALQAALRTVADAGPLRTAAPHAFTRAAL